MKRRSFLAAGGAAFGLTLLPPWTRPSRGDEGDPTAKPPLWIHLQAGGGWDPTMLCDPRPALSNLTFGVGGLTSSKGHTFQYADLGQGGSFSNDMGYSFGSFFSNNAEQLLVINGIFTATAGHATGACLAASGRLQPGHPSLFALIAKQVGADKAMPYIAAGGGYSHTAGLVAPTWVSDTQYLNQLAHIHTHANGIQELYNEPEKALLLAAREARLNRMIESEKRTHIRQSLERLQKARVGAATLESFKSLYDQGPAVTIPTASNKTMMVRSVFDQGFKAMVGYRTGLTAAAVLQGGSFDTHSNHDALHPRSLQSVLWGVDLLMQEAAAQQVPMVVLITSEFGRTAGYNVDQGKDHWPVTSWMMLQTPGLSVFNGGRVVGQSILDDASQQIGYESLDLATLTPSASGIPITPDGLHVALRKISGVDQLAESTQAFPLVGPDLSAVFLG
jgi:hypothetical protein